MREREIELISNYQNSNFLNAQNALRAGETSHSFYFAKICAPGTLVHTSHLGLEMEDEREGGRERGEREGGRERGEREGERERERRERGREGASDGRNNIHYIITKPSTLVLQSNMQVLYRSLCTYPLHTYSSPIQRLPFPLHLPSNPPPIPPPPLTP